MESLAKTLQQLWEGADAVSTENFLESAFMLANAMSDEEEDICDHSYDAIPLR